MMKFPVLEKFVNLMKDLNSIFPSWGRVKPNFRDIGMAIMAHDTPMVFLFLEKKLSAFDWKDNFCS